MTPPRRLILLRHGRTPWNHEGRVQGQHDVGLDDVGLAQADAVAPAVAALSPSVLWCSDLGRARQTVAPLAARTGLDVHYDARLREFSFGDTEGMSHTELAAFHAPSYAALRRGHYDQVIGAEPTDAVRARMLEALRELLATLSEGQTAVAVSHGAAIRVVVGALLSWPAEQFHTLHGLDNCGWVELEHHPELADEPEGAVRLRAYNRTV